MMAEEVEFLEGTLDADETSYRSFHNASVFRRYNLNECVTFLYNIKGKLPEVSTGIALYEENREEVTKSIDAALKRPMPEKSPLEKVKRKLFRAARNTRKIKQPCKFKSRERFENLQLFVTNRDVLRRKVRRGYLNEARKIVKRQIHIERLEEFNLNRTLQRFYENAHALLKDLLQLRCRARCALQQSLGHLNNLSSDEEISELVQMVTK